MDNLVSSIVIKHRKEQGLSLRLFAEALNEKGTRLSHQTIANWETGRHLPDRKSLAPLFYLTDGDWRGDFAREIRNALVIDEINKNNQLHEEAKGNFFKVKKSDDKSIVPNPIKGVI